MKSCCATRRPSRLLPLLPIVLLVAVAWLARTGSGKGSDWLPLLAALICPLSMLAMMSRMPHRNHGSTIRDGQSGRQDTP